MKSIEITVWSSINKSYDDVKKHCVLTTHTHVDNIYVVYFSFWSPKKIKFLLQQSITKTGFLGEKPPHLRLFQTTGDGKTGFLGEDPQHC